MSQQVQELINKIKSEGVEQAEQKARQIEKEAKLKADKIVAEAQTKAEQLLTHARQEQEKFKQAIELELKQITRDMILNLHKEVDQVLKRILSLEIKQALTSENVVLFILELIKEGTQQGRDDHIVVNVNERELKKIQDGVLSKLKEEIKKSITFQSDENINAGFTISFDSGKSSFVFSDKSLVEYLNQYLNKDVASLLKKSIS